MDSFDFMDFDSGSQNAEMHYQNGPYLPEASDCMRCGVCLNSCPTYQLTQDEQEGPRQRVQSLRQLIQHQETLDSQKVEHLQNCIQCRACEAVCPSQMAYADYFERAQQQLTERSFSTWGKWGLQLVARKKLRRILLPWMKVYQSTKWQSWLRKSGLFDGLGLARAENYLSEPESTYLHSEYTVQDAQGSVALFTGCLAEAFDRKTLEDAIKLINACGYNVMVSDSQQCCGAMHYHNGDVATAKDLMQQNIDAFARLPCEAVVYCATGCGSQLTEYSRLMPESEKAGDVVAKVMEVSSFLNQHWPDDLTPKAVNSEVWLHHPCSQRNVLKNQQDTLHLLQRIGGQRVQELPENHLCCGAGGSYMLTHPEQADALRDRKLAHLTDQPQAILLSANYGCALHLTKGKHSSPPKIMHPVSYLSQCLFSE